MPHLLDPRQNTAPLPASHPSLAPRNLPPSLQPPGTLEGRPDMHASANGIGVPAASKDGKVAMQAVVDALSASSIEPADPPEGSMRVALLKHQRLALGWMLSREGARSKAKALCPDGGMLADDQVCDQLHLISRCHAFCPMQLRRKRLQ